MNPRDEPIRFPAEVMAPDESFDQTGFELPSAPSEDPSQPELFGDDYSQPDAADGEPVLWPAGAAQAFPSLPTACRPTHQSEISPRPLTASASEVCLDP